MTTSSSRLQPQTPPAFTLFLEGVYILTNGGYLVSAANGGGVIGADAVQTQFKYSLSGPTNPPSVIGAYELFNVWTNSIGQFAFQTINGNFITAVDGGGRTTDVLHTDATTVAAWEEFGIGETGAPGAFSVSIETSNNHFLTAVGMGGKTTDAFHTDATEVGTWETFFIRKFGRLDMGDNLATAIYFIVDTDRKQAIAARDGGGQTQNTIQFFGQGGVQLSWALFTLIPQSNSSFALRTFSNTYVTAVRGGGLDYGTASSDNIHTDATAVGAWEQFRFIPDDDGSFLIQTVDGYYLGKRTFGGSAEGEYSTDISDPFSASTFWLIPAAFF